MASCLCCTTAFHSKTCLSLSATAVAGPANRDYVTGATAASGNQPDSADCGKACKDCFWPEARDRRGSPKLSTTGRSKPTSDCFRGLAGTSTSEEMSRGQVRPSGDCDEVVPCDARVGQLNRKQRLATLVKEDLFGKCLDEFFGSRQLPDGFVDGVSIPPWPGNGNINVALVGAVLVRKQQHVVAEDD